jgi:hypothetical protein
MNENELAIEINNWFNTKYDDSNRNFWNRNPVANVIKSNLKRKEHWKYATRGNPAKGGRKKKYNQARRDGYEGEFEG